MLYSTRFFYGWVIVAFTFVVQFVTVGLGYYTFSVYLKPLTEALSSDRFSIALALSIQALVIALFSPMAGRLFADKSIRALLFFGLFFLSTGLVLLSQISSLWQLYLLFGGFLGVGVVFLGLIPCNLLLANWFDKRRGTAIGISQFGLTVSATVLVPAITYLLIEFGWETSFVITGVASFVLLAPLIWLFAIRAPEDKGLHVDGVVQGSVSELVDAPIDWTFLKVVRNRDIWALTFTVGPCYMGIASVVLTMPSHATDLGFSTVEAAGLVATTTLLGALAKPLMGILSDYFDKKAIMAVAIAFQASGVVILLNASSYSALILAGILFGLGYGGIAPLWGVFLAGRFGRAAFAKIMGANMPMITPFNIIGLPATAYIFGLTGSYIPAYAALLGGYAIAAVALLTVRTAPLTLQENQELSSAHHQAEQ